VAFRSGLGPVELIIRMQVEQETLEPGDNTLLGNVNLGETVDRFYS
jgi:hypothetical protein